MDHGHSFLYSSTPPQHFSPSFLIYIPCHWLALFPHISFTSAQATRRTRSILKCTHQLTELTPLKQSLFHLTAVHHIVENAWRWQFLSCFFFFTYSSSFRVLSWKMLVQVWWCGREFGAHLCQVLRDELRWRKEREKGLLTFLPTRFVIQGERHCLNSVTNSGLTSELIGNDSTVRLDYRTDYRLTNVLRCCTYTQLQK